MIKEAFAGEADGTTAQAQIGSFAQLMGEDSLILLPEPAHSFLRGLLKPAFSPEVRRRWALGAPCLAVAAAMRVLVVVVVGGWGGRGSLQRSAR